MNAKNTLHKKVPAKVKSLLKILFSIAFMALILYEGRKELATIKLSDLKALLLSLSPWVILLFVAGSFLGLSASTLHDFAAARELSVKLPKRKVYKISFIANTLNNILGGFSSAGARIVLYKKEGISAKEALYYDIIIISSATTGLSVFALLSLLDYGHLRAFIGKYEYIPVAIGLIVFSLPVYFLINKVKWVKEKVFHEDGKEVTSTTLLFRFFGVSIFEWGATSLYFSLLAHYFSPHARFLDIFFVFIIASAIGVVSLMPGAIGTFDVSLLLGLSMVGVKPQEAAAALMFFRLLYHILPLFVALTLSTAILFKKNRNS